MPSEKKGKRAPAKRKATARHTVRELSFISRGTRCAAFLYRPRGKKNPPLVVMAHGFGAEMAFGLHPFAERFTREGLAVFMFDYRCFGRSGGTPRNLVSPRRHVQDWQAALDFARSIPDVDPGRVALWGSSFSGGHVIVTASRNPTVRAVVCQVPFVDGLAVALDTKAWKLLRGTAAAARDLFRMLTLREPYYVRMAGRPEELALMNSPDSLDGYMALVPRGHPFRNECPGRIYLTVVGYRPAAFASRVRCPVHVVIAVKDSLIAAASVERAAAKIPHASVKRVDVGHFDVYRGKVFDEVVRAEAEFLRRELLA